MPRIAWNKDQINKVDLERLYSSGMTLVQIGAHYGHSDVWANEEFKFDDRNGVTLCKECHYAKHRGPRKAA